MPAPRRPRLHGRARALLPHAAARAVPRPARDPPAAPRDRRDRARERPRQPGRHDVRVPDRRGDGRVRAPTSCAPTKPRGRSSARTRSGATSRRSTRVARRRRADRDVPRVAASSWSGRAAGCSATGRARSPSRRRSRSSRRRSRARRSSCPTARAAASANGSTPRPPSYAARGVPAELAARIAALDLLPDALDITELADAHAVEVERVGRRSTTIVGDRLRLDWLHDRIVELPRSDRWDALARNALREDVAAEHRAVADAVLRTGRAPARRRGRVRRTGPPASRPRSTARSRSSTTSRPKASSTSRPCRSPSASSAPST